MLVDRFEDPSPDDKAAAAAVPVTLRNFHLMDGKESTAGQYTLSKRHGNTLNSGSVGAGASDMAKPNILSGGFFDPK